jgi:hypothetical protein
MGRDRFTRRRSGREILADVRNVQRQGFRLAHRGDFVAKGFEEPVRVYEVRWRD